MAASPVIPLGSFPFSAYRLLSAAGERLSPCAFLSVGHMFEAEKFRAFRPDLFELAMIQPSVKEARKLSRRHRDQWRGDWLAVRSRVLACALTYAWLGDPEPERWLRSAEEIAAALHDIDLPGRFVLNSAHEFVRLRDSPRVAFLGANAAPPDAVGRRVNIIHKRVERAWRLAHWQGRHTSWRVHDWAVQQLVPVQYLAEDSARLSDGGLALLKSSVDHAVIFERRKGKAMDRALRSLRSERRIQVELDLYDAVTTRIDV